MYLLFYNVPCTSSGYLCHILSDLQSFHHNQSTGVERRHLLSKENTDEIEVINLEENITKQF
jgi:hypothetical protein